MQWWLKLEMSAKLYTFNAEVREKFALLSRVQVITIGDPQDNKTIFKNIMISNDFMKNSY